MSNHCIEIDGAIQWAIVQKRMPELELLLKKHEVFLKDNGRYNIYSHYLKRSSGHNNNAFVTINYKPGTNVDEIIKYSHAIHSKKWISNTFYTLEQRGEDVETMGTGIHMHMLIINPNKIKSHIHREIYNTVKHSVGTKHHVDVRMVPDEWVEDKKDYMKGIKWDEKKKLKSEIDLKWRENEHIEPYYEYNLQS